MANPNRVRALVGAFSTANPTASTARTASATGYSLTVLTVEKRNPQIAARLATALRSWRSLEPVRQEKAREALLTLAAAEGLSATCAISSNARWPDEPLCRLPMVSRPSPRHIP